MKQKIERLRSLMEKATPGPWDIWAEKIDGDRYAAISELTEQVQSTDPVGEYLYLLESGGKCPATTGCGPQSESNAALIVEAINALPSLLSHIDALEARVARDKVPMDYGTANDGPKAIELSPPTSLRRLGTRAEAAERALEEAVKVLRTSREAMAEHLRYLGGTGVPMDTLRQAEAGARAFLTKRGEK